MIEKDELSHALTEYYMPYAMKVITDRALPDVRDGLKPIARKILWTLWNNGTKYNTPRDKCGKIVGDILKIHNHGDSSIYQALSLLTEQNEGLLHPFIDGEGAFGKVYSNDSPSAMRYTSARLNKFSEEMFGDINKNTVKFIGEDKSHTQPLILTNSYPNLLIKPNSGVAVGEACNWASFNLSEICTLSQAYIKDTSIDVYDYIKAPDFTTGSYVIVSKSEMTKILDTGRGSFKLKGKYRFHKDTNIIEIYEIPFNTNVNDIIKDINNLMNAGLFKDIIDVKDETGFDKRIKKEAMGIGIEVKKNSNIESIMKILFKKTRLETSFSCNFNCLVGYKPKVLGIKNVLDEWIKFRVECIKRAIIYDINEKGSVLHYLKGLEKVLLDIDKAIDIIRHSKDDDTIISNLMSKFDIDISQANETANMKLRNINEKYILNKIKSIVGVENEITTLQLNLDSDEFVKETIISQLEQVKNKYGIPRKSEIMYCDEIEKTLESDLVEDYNPTIVLTTKYIKKTRKYSDTQKLTEDDSILQMIQCNNKDDVLLFTNKGNCLSRKVYELKDYMPSEFGTFMTTWLGEYLQKDEKVIYILATNDYKGDIVTIYKNGRVGKTTLQSYKTKTNRQVAQQAYSTTSELLDICLCEKDEDIFFLSSECKGLVVNLSNFNSKGSRLTNGDFGMKLGKSEGNEVVFAKINPKDNFSFTIKTQKGKEKEIYMDDLAEGSQVEKSWYDHLKCENRNTQGNFIINTRQSKDKVIDIVVNK